MSLPHIGLLLLYCLMSGSNYVVARLGVSEVPPLFLAIFRFALLAIVCAPFLKWHGWAHARRVSLAALFSGGLNLSLMWLGISLSSASIAAMVFQTSLPIAVILSIFWLGEQVGWRRWLGVVLAFSGILIIGFDPAVVDYKLGILVIVASAACAAVGQILLRKEKNLGLMELQAWTGLTATPLLIVGSFLLESGQFAALAAYPWVSAGVVLYSVFLVSMLAHSLRFFVIQRNDVAVVSTICVLAPVFGVLLGALLLHEPITWQIALGFVIVLVGVLIISLRQAKRAPEAARMAAADGPVPTDARGQGETPR